jgi:acetylornithine deacetylase/succinyl-diaminopimelate desuccinylase-like protein
LIENEKFIETYREFLRFRTISAEHRRIRETAHFIWDLLVSNGFSAQVMETDGHPVVTGSLGLGKNRTLLVYNHYDVQPVDPIDEWKSDPFSADIRDGRIYARGSSDNKGTLVARLFGIINAVKMGKINVNLKIIYEREEEIGSPSLEKFVNGSRDLLSSDAVIMEGSSLGEDGRPIVSLGVKGLVYAELEEEIADSDMHSSFASIAPNAAWNIIKSLSNLNENERILIPDFYDSIRPLSSEEKKLLAEYPFHEESFKESFGLKYLKYEGKDSLVKSLFCNPTFNIDGIFSEYTGEGSKTVTPRKAFAKVDFRPVPDQDPVKIYHSFIDALRKTGFKGSVNHLGLEYPVRTSVNSMISRAMIESAKYVYNKEPIVMNNSPGTQPMALFTRNLGIKEAISAIGVGDQISRAHAPNESVSIDNFFLAI